MPRHVTPSVAADLLDRHRLRAGRRHGQHFLVDPNTVARIVRLAEISPDETILEVGPGLGSLTVDLASVAKRVVAIELDETVADALREVLDGVSNVELVVGDAVRADLGDLAGGPARMVANLPYNVATPVLMRVLDDAPEISGGLVMVQRELGERWTASPRTRAYGAVTLHVDYHAEAAIVGDVPRSVFMPPPKVSSVLVSFRRHERPPVEVDDRAAFIGFIHKAFAHRRKTLRNSLAAAGYETSAVEEALREVGLDARARPEEIDLQTFAHLHGRL